MYKIIILYSSTYGQAKRCAKLLNSTIADSLKELESTYITDSEVSIDTKDIRKINLARLCESDCIVYCVDSRSERYKSESFIKTLINGKLGTKKTNIILVNIGITEKDVKQISSWTNNNIKVSRYYIEDYLDINDENILIKSMNKIRYLLGIEDDVLSFYEGDANLCKVAKKILQLCTLSLIKGEVQEKKRTFFRHIRDFIETT